MLYVARKINIALWRERPAGFAQDEVPADSLSRKKELKTDKNKLSFWRIGQVIRTEDVENVALAMASEFQILEGLDLAWIDRETVAEEGVRFVPSEGQTPIPELADLHEDATLLDLKRLSVIARHLAEAVRTQNRWHSFTREEVLQLLVKAVRQNKVSADHLKKEVKQEVKAQLERQ